MPKTVYVTGIATIFLLQTMQDTGTAILLQCIVPGNVKDAGTATLLLCQKLYRMLVQLHYFCIID